MILRNFRIGRSDFVLAVSALRSDMTGCKRSRSAVGASATSPSAQTRFSGRTQGTHAFNKQDKWESLVNSSEQAEADIAQPSPKRTRLASDSEVGGEDDTSVGTELSGYAVAQEFL